MLHDAVSCGLRELQGAVQCAGAHCVARRTFLWVWVFLSWVIPYGAQGPHCVARRTKLKLLV